MNIVAMAKVVNPLDICKYIFIFIFFIPRFANSELAKRAKKAPRFTATRHTLMKLEIFRIYSTNIAHIFEICKKTSMLAHRGIVPHGHGGVVEYIKQ